MSAPGRSVFGSHCPRPGEDPAGAVADKASARAQARNTMPPIDGLLDGHYLRFAGARELATLRA
jgi:hypothetical protein